MELQELDSAFNTMAEQLEGAQTRIEAERVKLATTIESLGDALIVCDSSGAVVTVNPRAREIAPVLRPGVPADVYGSPLPRLEEALGGEVTVERDDRTLSITAARLGSRSGDGVVWTVRDISERARLERVKSDFVATASHDLRSPLTSIKGFVELLGRSDTLGEREREFVEVILLSTNRLVDLVNDLLDVARLEAGKVDVHPRLFDLSETVTEVAVLMAPSLADKDQRLDLDLPSSLPRALADPAQVRRIVTNLVSNAHQYTEAGGSIAIALSGGGGRLRIAVSDTGRGMTPEDAQHVFERFVRRDERNAGTGLGLSIVKSLVDLQGGS
ncbi:MAG: sensor histidine kinase, partial [Gammaproteobacteria bacterium]